MHRLKPILFVLMLLFVPPVLMAQDAADIPLNPQPFTFGTFSDAGEIDLTFGVPEGWFAAAGENGILHHLANVENYARRLSPMGISFDNGEQYIRLNALATAQVSADLENPDAARLFRRFGISEAGEPQPLDLGDGRDVAIIEPLRMFGGHGVALLEQRGDMLIEIHALAGESEADFIRELALRVLASSLPDSAQDETDSDTAIEQRGIHMDVSFPAWVAAYPQIDATVNAYLNAALRDHMQAMIDSDFDYVAIPRLLPFKVTYEEVSYGEDIVTLVFTAYADYGGLYPVDWLDTLTFDTSADRQLSIGDLFNADVDVPDVLRPFVEDALDPSLLESLDLSDTNAYAVFTLAPDTLTLLYPTERSGPTHAGMSPVVISLDDLADALNPAIFGD